MPPDQFLRHVRLRVALRKTIVDTQWASQCLAAGDADAAALFFNASQQHAQHAAQLSQENRHATL